jgi:hypothetical protein
MLFQLPPAVPMVEAIAEAVVMPDRLFADCKKDSRDCFPEDRVGLAPAIVSSQRLDLSWENVLTWARGQ